MSELIPNLLLSELTARPAAARLWIAYSGGLDSHVLLHAAAGLRDRLGSELRAVHLDHQLHPQSAHWSEHCRRICAELDVPMTERRLAVERRRGESLEALARDARYAALAALLGPEDAVATAQHRDDQAETLLLALLRGSGVHGLAAMPVRSRLGVGHLLRPLLGVDRAALRAYAEHHGLEWIDDPSNMDTAHDRNLLRHRVLPLLRERWPGVAATLTRSAAHCAEAAALIDGLADERLPVLAGGRPGTLSVRRLRALEPAMARAVLRRWLMRTGFGPPDQGRLGRILDEVLPARVDADPLVAWDGCEVRRYRDDLFALAPLPAPPEGWTAPWDGAGTLALPDALGRLVLSRPVPAGGPGLRVSLGPGAGASLRCRRALGPRRSLKELFQQAGVPPWLRRYVPLVGSEGQLEVIGGVARCGEDAPLVIWEGHPWVALDIFAEGVPPPAR